MRRDILRFPVGREFKKILEDDHEWCVITDLHLKILKTKRGKIDIMPGYIEAEAFAELDFYRKTPQKIRVYVLHTHPGTSRPLPSSGDIDGFIKDTINKPSIKVLKGFIISGYGVITKKGIIIIKLPLSNHRLHILADNFKSDYRERANNKYDKIRDNSNTDIDNHRDAQITERAHLDTFRKLAKEEGDIKFKTILKKSIRFRGRR